MLRAGIVGIKNSKEYISIIERIDLLNLTGIYDPSFQIDPIIYCKTPKAFDQFDQFLEVCDLVIFSSDDKVFIDLMYKSLSNSKAVFLDRVHKLHEEHLKQLSNLTDEANSLIRINHPALSHQLFDSYSTLNVKPILVQEDIEIQDLDKMVKSVREEITTLLYLINHKVRKIRTNIMSSIDAIPNVYQISLEFNNGCLCNLLASSVNKEEQKHIRVIGLNSNIELDFKNASIDIVANGMSNKIHLETELNSTQAMVTKQLDEFSQQVLDNSLQDNSLRYEIEACKIMQKVTDKLKLSISII